MKFLCMPNYDDTLDQLYNLCLKLFCRVASFFCSELSLGLVRLGMNIFLKKATFFHKTYSFWDYRKSLKSNRPTEQK